MMTNELLENLLNLVKGVNSSYILIDKNRVYGAEIESNHCYVIKIYDPICSIDTIYDGICTDMTTLKNCIYATSEEGKNEIHPTEMQINNLMSLLYNDYIRELFVDAIQRVFRKINNRLKFSIDVTNDDNFNTLKTCKTDDGVFFYQTQDRRCIIPLYKGLLNLNKNDKTIINVYEVPESNGYFIEFVVNKPSKKMTINTIVFINYL